MNTHDRVADAALGTAGGSTLFGITIGTINEYLQAGSFIVAIISGLLAIRYYYIKARSIKNEA